MLVRKTRKTKSTRIKYFASENGRSYLCNAKETHMLNAFSSSSATTLPPEIIKAAKQGGLTTIDPKYVDLQDDLGRTLAYHALDNNHLELANMLLRLQTDITITTVSGWSILHLIAK